MDLSTRYLGLKLTSPLVASASPMSDEIDTIKKMEEEGIGAVVLRSLFEEQLSAERDEVFHHLTSHTDSFSEAQNFFPKTPVCNLGPETYLEHIRKAKAAVQIPIIASLNGATIGGWTQFSKLMAEAGADALELNIYNIPTDMNLSSADLEKRYVEILKAVKGAVKIPVALKVSPYFTNMAYAAKKFVDAGADALVLFNRFYQANIDIENLEVKSEMYLNAPQTVLLPLTWIAILYGRVRADLAATSGIYRPEDVIKCMMAGANVAMLCSILLRNGISRISAMNTRIAEWLTEHEYESLEQMRGSMSQKNCEHPSLYERAQYIRTIQSYKPESTHPGPLFNA